MTDALVAELATLRQRVELTARNIEEASNRLASEQQTLRQTVDEYAARRVKLVEEELRARGETWCTNCKSIVAADEAVLMFIEGIEQISCGYEGGSWRHEDFASLQRVCPDCRQRNLDRHGRRGFGPWGSGGQDKTYFYAFEVEGRDDGFYARRFDQWARLDDKCSTLKGLPDRLVEELAAAWGLPPRIRIESRWSSPPALSIDEQVEQPLAAAS